MTYSKTRRKIALAFMFLASIIIIVTTVTIVVLANLVMDRQARASLDTSLQAVTTDYSANALADKEVKFQASNRSSSASADYSALPNISELKSEIDLSKVEKLKSVYARVVKANGDIAITSDLFETYGIKDITTGFSKLFFGDNCVYLLTAKTASGDTIQTAQYCPFTNNQQVGLFGLMAIIGIVTSVFTYFLGLLMAHLFLRPLQRSTQDTKQFIQNVYHELHTPITVAITTVEAAKLSQDFAEGIDSVQEDLHSMRETLITLHSSLNHDLQAQAKADLAEVLAQLAREYKLMFTAKKVTKQVSPDVAHIIFRNLVENSTKYGTDTKMQLDSKCFVITNKVSDTNAVDLTKLFSRGYRGENARTQPGQGLGLAIVKELATQVGWSVSAAITDQQLAITIRF